MSDFLFANRPMPAGRLSRLLEKYLGPVTARVEERHGPWGTLAVAVAEHDAGVVEDDGRFVTVLLGEPLAREGSASGYATSADWRSRVHGWLRDGTDEAWDDRLDGPFAALGIDVESGAGLVVSDVFSWIPLFASSIESDEGGAIVIGSHVDAVAEAAGRAGAIDPVSAADWLAHFTVVYPYTMYPDVRQLPPGSVRRFGPAGWTGGARTFWAPVERNPYRSLAEAGEALREALKADLRAACAGQSTVGLLLSGGEDSRAVLGALPPGVEIEAFIYSGADNREVRSARRVARAYGARITVGIRQPDHYLDGFARVAPLAGSQQVFLDVHGFGFHRSLGLSSLPVVLGGLSSDALLKGDNLSIARRRVVGGRWSPPRIPLVRPDLLDAAGERRTEHLRRLSEMRPESAGEWMFLWPFTQRKYAANLHGNRRLFRSHEPFISNPVVRVAAAAPQGWKAERRLFRAAALPLLKPSWWVPHSRNRFPYFGAWPNRLARGPLGLARRVRALAAGERGLHQEPWPVWEQVVTTEAMARLERHHSIWRSRAAAALAPGAEEAMEAAARERWTAWRRLAALQLAYLSSLASGSGEG